MKLKMLALMAIVVAAPLVAHHSFAAEYDAKKPITLKGTVTYGAHVKVSGHRAAVVGTKWSKVVKLSGAKVE